MRSLNKFSTIAIILLIAISSMIVFVEPARAVTVLWRDGGEAGDSSFDHNWYSPPNVINIVSTYKYYGGYSVYYYHANDTTYTYDPASEVDIAGLARGGERWYHFWIRLDEMSHGSGNWDQNKSLNSVFTAGYWGSPAAGEMQININGSNLAWGLTPHLVTADVQNLARHDLGEFPVGTEAFIDIGMKISTTISSADGFWKVWINGALEYNMTGVNTPFDASFIGSMWGLPGMWDTDDIIGLYLDNMTITDSEIIYGQPVSSITAEDFDIDFDAGDWIFCDSRYYNFTMIFNLGGNVTLTNIGIRFNDTRGNEVQLIYNNATSTWTDGGNSTFVSYGNVYTSSYSNVTGNATMVMQVFPKRALIDTFNTTAYYFGNASSSSANLTTGWTQGPTFNIYSQGGLNYLVTSGNAGRNAGGDFFNLYTYNNSYARCDIFWQNIVHVKYLLSLAWSTDIDTDSNTFPQWTFGFGYYVNGSWIPNGIFVTMFLYKDAAISYGYAYGSDYQYANFDVTIYRSKGATNTLIYSSYLMGFYDQDLEEVKIWVDIWLNKANASSVMGIRVTPYYYGVYNNADWLHRTFSGNAWGVYFENRSEIVAFVQLQDLTGQIFYSHDIELARLYAIVEQAPNAQYNGTGSIERIQQFDMEFSSDRDGIPTPSFEPPKMPDMPSGGFIGVLSSWLSALVNALAPAFTYMWSGIVYVLDGAMQALTGQSGVFSGFVTMITSVVSGAVTFMTTLASQFVNFVLVIGNTVTWFFGTFFSVIWGIVNFIFLTPAFNILTAITTIFGIAFAWLGGTTYTNGFGQVFDFSYLSAMHFGGFTGGIVIFFVIFVVGFFLTIMSCIATLSLGPIMAPISLFMAFVNFVIRIIEVIYNLVMNFVRILVQIAHALRDIAPRPFGV